MWRRHGGVLFQGFEIQYQTQETQEDDVDGQERPQKVIERGIDCTVWQHIVFINSATATIWSSRSMS